MVYINLFWRTNKIKNIRIEMFLKDKIVKDLGLNSKTNITSNQLLTLTLIILVP